jgi:hypothetical protein
MELPCKSLGCSYVIRSSMPSSAIYGMFVLYLPLTSTNCVRSCMEHSIDLSAKAFARAIAPSSGQAILKKMKKALEDTSANSSGMFDLDEFDERLAHFDFDDNNDEENEGDVDKEEDTLEAEADAADAIGKALLLVKQVGL